LHVVDASHPDPEGQIGAVREVLREIAGDEAVAGVEVIVFAKADLAEAGRLAALLAAHPRSVAASARTGVGLDQLRAAIEAALPRPPVEVDVVVPFGRGDLVARAHQTGEVLSETYGEDGTRLRARVGQALAAELARV
jgi:GTP-binding protein HflX